MTTAIALKENIASSNRIGFTLFIAFILSWFLRVSERVLILGTLRFDLFLIAAIVISIILGTKEIKEIGE